MMNFNKKHLKFIIIVLAIFCSSNAISGNKHQDITITILTNGIGNEGSIFPIDIVDLYKPIGNVVPKIFLKKYDYSLKSFVDVVVQDKNGGIFDYFRIKSPIKDIKSVHDHLSKAKITKEFSTPTQSTQSDNSALNSEALRIAKEFNEKNIIFLESKPSANNDNKAIVFNKADEIIQYISDQIKPEKTTNETQFLIYYHLLSLSNQKKVSQSSSDLNQNKISQSSSDIIQKNISQSSSDINQINNSKALPDDSQFDRDLFAVIEIGASGIKPIILQIVYIEEDDRFIIKEKGKPKSSRKYEITTKDANNLNAFHPNSINAIADDIYDYIYSFQKNNLIPKDHIYIVGSSGVANIGHSELLKRSIMDKTGFLVDFVTAEQESKYVFDGVIKLIPKDRGQQDLRRLQALVIDIGSGNTKGGLYNTSNSRIDTFEIKYGTKTFSQIINEQKGNHSFSDVSQKLGANIIRPAIQSELARVPGINNKSRVYLVGGIPWAISTLLSLDSPKYADRSLTRDQEVYTVISFHPPSDIDRLYNRAIGSKAIDLICDNNIDVPSITDPIKREKRLKEINNICTGIFSMDQLIGGMDLMKVLASELNFKDKYVFFIQNALYAWPLGYIRDKIEKKSNLDEKNLS